MWYHIEGDVCEFCPKACDVVCSTTALNASTKTAPSSTLSYTYTDPP